MLGPPFWAILANFRQKKITVFLKINVMNIFGILKEYFQCQFLFHLVGKNTFMIRINIDPG
jgi:hypothetical protein